MSINRFFNSENSKISPRQAVCENCIFTGELVFAFVLAAFMIGILESIYNKFLKKQLHETRNKQLRKSKILNIQDQAKEMEAERNRLAETLTEITTTRPWARTKQSIIDPELLDALLKMINDEDRDPSAKLEEIKDDYEGDEVDKPEITDNEQPSKSHFRKSKGVRQIQHVPRLLTLADIIIKWEDYLPQYNLTQDTFVDPKKPVYRLKSGDKFVFINQFLLKFLELKFPDVLEALLILCKNGNDKIINGSKNQNVFIMREEANAKKLDKGIHIPDKKIVDDDKIKNEIQTDYIKVKFFGKQQRIFGASVSKTKIAVTNKNNTMTLFYLYGIKTTKKKIKKKNVEKSIMYFPPDYKTISSKR